MLRAFSTLEGLGKALDPNYKFADVARPYVLELLELEVSRQTARVQVLQGLCLCRRGNRK